MGLGIRSGKLPWNTLSQLLGKLPVEDPDLVMGPSIGEDAAIVRFKDGYLVVHSDPITAASKRIGWLAIHIAANDIAVRGVKPKWFLPVVLFPDTYSLSDIEQVFNDIGEAVEQIGGVVIGGHTEITPGLNHPIISTTAIGYSPGRLVLTRDARVGDYVVVIGRVGGEGVGVIAWDFAEKLREMGVEHSVLKRAKEYIYDISVVDKALAIKYLVNSMHDPTEGGVIQGLREIGLASGLSIVFDMDKLVLDENVELITRLLNIDPLKLLSSGALIATIPPSRLEELENILDSKKYAYSVCGRVEQGEPGEVLIRRNDRVVDIVREDVVDEIYKLW